MICTPQTHIYIYIWDSYSFFIFGLVVVKAENKMAELFPFRAVLRMNLDALLEFSSFWSQLGYEGMKARGVYGNV